MDQFDKQVGRARRRLGLDRFLSALGWCCCATLTVALVLVLIDRFWPLGVDAWIWAAAAVGTGVITAIGWAVVRDRGPLEAAIAIDHRFGLKERVSSVVAMSEEQRRSAAGHALVDDASRRVTRIDIGDGFRLRPGRQILLPLIPGALVALVALVIGQGAVDPSAQASDRDGVTKQVRQSAEGLRRKLAEQKEKAQEEGLKDAKDLFERLEQGTEDLAAKPETDRKQALVELNDLKRQIETRSKDLAGAKRMREQFNELKDIDRGPADRFMEEVRRGNFDKALEELNKLKAAIEDESLTKEERDQLAKQLEQMKKKLEDMADAHQEAMEDLQQRIEQARAEGRDDEANRLEEMLDALRQQLPQMGQMGQMADRMQQCAQCLRDGQLQDAGEMLGQLQGELESLQSQLSELDLLDDAMNELAQCRQRMNCPMCGGAGCADCQGQPGIGLGAGRGIGDRPEAEDNVGLYDAKSPVNVQKGQATVVGDAGWAAIRGNVQEQILEQYESTKRVSEDPLTGQRLPRRMRQGVQQYFDSFRGENP